MPDLADRVAELLTASHRAHRQYRAALPKPQAPGSSVLLPGTPSAVKDELLTALNTREQAHALDPQHTAPAWRAEVHHDLLIDFYHQQIAKESAV